ncbi:MAG: CDP-glycerol glycerophosphotransferase family protein [Rhodospirillales bacterium]|nr:CDP-glycerol glycerophosphotransferase family protein [Rhodospirillales bacterium]
MKKTILMVFHDAGGTAAAVPLIAEIRCHYRTAIYAHHTACKELQNHDVTLCEHLSNAEALDVLDTHRPDLVLTGTSAAGDTIDRAIIKAAQEKNIPTLSLLDYWLNYQERFADNEGIPLSCLPDIIAVMNDDAKTEMIKEGIPEGLIVITGSPRFEKLAQSNNDYENTRKVLAQRYGLAPEKIWVLYLSQPLTSHFGGEQQSIEKLGYTEKDSINCLLKGMGDLPVQVIARLHPREDISNRDLFKNMSAVFIQEEEIATLISASDLVTGMSTVALIDAYLMKKPVISIQPNQKNMDLCYLTRCHLAPKCDTPEDVETYIEKVMAKENFIDFNANEMFQKKASVNLQNLISRLINTNDQNGR